MTDTEMLWEIMASDKYEFLRTNHILVDKMILLGFGGSHAYGTNVETSDVDLRGICFNPLTSLIGMSEFEQFEDKETDTVIYGLNKMFKLLLQCNPNTIELIGLKPEHYFIVSDYGQKILDNKKIFLSKRAVATFGGYANAQLRRLQNALARDSYPQAEKEKHILGTLTHAMDSILERYHKVNGEKLKYDFSNDNGRMVHAFREYNQKMQEMEQYKNFESGEIHLYPDKAVNPDFDVEIFCDVCLHHYPLRDYRNIWNEINSIVKDYDKLGKRNTKKDEQHLNKHSMHLIRLYLMCIDILEKEEINTFREKEHDLLMDIRNGKYMKEDGTYRSEFFEMVDEYEKRMQYAAEYTSLPDMPDFETAEDLLCEMNENHILDMQVY